MPTDPLVVLLVENYTFYHLSFKSNLLRDAASVSYQWITAHTWMMAFLNLFIFIMAFVNPYLIYTQRTRFTYILFVAPTVPVKLQICVLIIIPPNLQVYIWCHFIEFNYFPRQGKTNIIHYVAKHLSQFLINILTRYISFFNQPY